MMNPMIYYMIVDVAYKKGKATIPVRTWVVSSYETVGEIMSKDRKTMASLESRLYGKGVKSAKSVIIRKIVDRTALTRITNQAMKDRL